MGRTIGREGITDSERREREVECQLSDRVKTSEHNNGGSYSLRNGPYMRPFLDGYYPIRVSMEIRYAGNGLTKRVSPMEQPGFAIYRKTDSIDFDAVFENTLRTEFIFSAYTL